MPPHVLVVTEDPVGEALGGAAIRAYEIARALTSVAEVTLAAPGTEPPALAPARHVPYALDDPTPLRDLLADADAIVMRPPGPLVGAWLRRSKARIIYDLIDPLPLDLLEAQGSAPRTQQVLWHTIALDHFLEALHTGHHFICAGRRQRDLYLGALLATRLISPAAYRADPSFRLFIDRVPFGVPAEPPQRLPGVGPRAKFPGLGDDSQIVLWNGGIWNWLDPLTAVRATVAAAEQNPRVRLVFMGTHLGEGVEWRMAREAHELARRLGVLGELVFFNEGFVAYAERASWMLDADCAISTNLDHLESNFAFRTRLLDCLWAGVPAVCTGGDEVAELFGRDDLGVTVPYGDVGAVAAAIVEVLERGRDAYADRLLAAAEQLTWTKVIEPLRRFVLLPGPPVALGAPLARRMARPVQRARGTAVRLARALRAGG